eukprot:UN18962
MLWNMFHCYIVRFMDRFFVIIRYLCFSSTEIVFNSTPPRLTVLCLSFNNHFPSTKIYIHIFPPVMSNQPQTYPKIRIY